jgi:restriction system protein
LIEQEGLPDIPQMMLVTLDALCAVGGSASFQELDQKILELEGLTEAEQTFTMPNDDRARINYYLAWAHIFTQGRRD